MLRMIGAKRMLRVKNHEKWYQEVDNKQRQTYKQEKVCLWEYKSKTENSSNCFQANSRKSEIFQISQMGNEFLEDLI